VIDWSYPTICDDLEFHVLQRSLFVVDALANHYGDVVKPFFEQNSSGLGELVTASHRALRLKAESTMQLLGVMHVPGGKGDATSNQQEDLIDFGSMNQKRYGSVIYQKSNPSYLTLLFCSEAPDLLTGSIATDTNTDRRDVDDSSGRRETDPDDLFSNMEVKNADSSDPLAFLQQADPAYSSLIDGAEAPFAPPRTPADFDPLETLMSGNDASYAPIFQQDTGASSAFGFLSGTSTPIQQVPVGSAPNSSAFSFLGGNSTPLAQQQSSISALEDAFSHLSENVMSSSAPSTSAPAPTQLYSLNGAPVRQPSYVHPSSAETSPLRNVGKKTSTTDQFSFVQDMMNGPILTGSP
jgi:hypothetical protein